MPIVLEFKTIQLMKARAKYPDWISAVPRERALKEAYIIAAKYEEDYSKAFIVGMSSLFTPKTRRNFLVSWKSKSPTKIMKVFPFLEKKNEKSTIIWRTLIDELDEAYKVTIKAAGHEALDIFNNKMKTNITFALQKAKIPAVEVNPVSIDWMENRSLSLIKEGLLPHQKDTVQSLLTDRIKRGVRKETVYKEIEDNIGLTSREFAATETRFQLHIESGMPWEEASDLTGKYREQLLKARSMRIARTEMIDAQAYGRRTVWQDAAKAGHFKEGSIERVWVAQAGCPICEDLDGTGAPLNGTYSSTEGPLVGPTAHPN